jgi:hypothetical protein
LDVHSTRAPVRVAAGRPEERDMMILTLAATVFAATVVFHNFDHMRRGGHSVSALVFWVGSAAIVLEVVVVFLVFMRHRLAPLAAILTGLSLAGGYAIVHFTPERGFFSDSLISGHGQAISIVAASLETFGALLLGLAGLNYVSHAGLAASLRTVADKELSPWTTVRHPVVAAFAIANLVLFLLAFASR